MRQLLIVGVILVAGLLGCASAPDKASTDLRSWAEPAIKEARAGNLPWSDYYKGLYERLRATSFDNTPFLMQVTSNMIDAANAYEAGSVDKNQFDTLRRQAEIAVEANTQQLTKAQQAQQSAAWANVMQNLANQQQQRSQYFQQQLNIRKTCNTRWTGFAWQTVCE